VINHIDAIWRYADAHADQRRRSGSPSSRAGYPWLAAIGQRWPRSAER
jgi:hypothetical protein